MYNLLKRGTEQEFEKYYNIVQGEVVMIVDTKQLGMCFEDGKAEFINFTEDVDKEKADKLINLLEKFMEMHFSKLYDQNLKR